MIVEITCFALCKNLAAYRGRVSDEQKVVIVHPDGARWGDGSSR
jgi:hypothetical protein